MVFCVLLFSAHHNWLEHTTTMPEYGDRYWVAVGRYWRSTSNAGAFEFSNTVGYVSTGEHNQPLKGSTILDLSYY